MMKRLKMMLTAAVVTLAVQAEANDAVWTSTVNSAQTWNSAANWLDGYIGGATAANADDINFAYPFTPAGGNRFGQPIDMGTFKPSFHSVTGLPFQVITRTGDNVGTLTVVDPGAFRGVWATAGLRTEYVVNPESAKTAEFQRVAHGWDSSFKVAAGGKARIRDLLGEGTFTVNGGGELVLKTPRTLGTRAVLGAADATLTVESLTEPATPTPAEGASWRFDAAATETLRTYYNEEDGRTYVTNWCDANGGEAMAYAKTDICSPFISPIVVNGHHLIDFGGYKDIGNPGAYHPSGADELYGPAAFMLVGKTNSLSVAGALGKDVCEMFIVVKVHAEIPADSSKFHSVLGHHDTYQIPMFFTPSAMFNRAYSRTTYGGASGASEGDYRAWINGEPYIATSMNDQNALAQVATWNPTQLNVIAVNFKGGTRPTLTALGTTRRSNGAECGGFALAEALIYKTELTDAERRQTIEYLKRKWLSGVESKPFDLDAAIIGNASAKVNVEAGNTAKIRTLRLRDRLSAGTCAVKTGGGTLEIEEVMPQSATLEVRGGDVMLSHDTPVASTDRADVPTDGMLCWLDATSDDSKFEFDANGITKWKDCRDEKSDTVFATSVVKSGDARPTKETDATSGLTVVDFGNAVATTSPYAKITVNGSNLTKVKESFIVWKRNGNGVAGLLHASDRNGGLRDDSVARLFYPGWVSGNVSAMNWTVDGRPIGAGLYYDFIDVGNGSLAVVNNSSARELSSWCYLAQSGWLSTGNGGGCAIGEVIAYNRQLTDAERRNVTAYLMNKWENGATHSLDTDDTVTKIAFTSGAAPKVGTRTDRTVTAIEGSGTLTKTGAGKLTVTSLDAGVTALDIHEGDLGLASLSGITAVSYRLAAAGISGSVVLDGAVTLPAAMTVNVAVDSAFREYGEYPLVKVGSFASAPDISGWTLNVSGASDKLVFSLVRKADGIYLQSARRGFMVIFR